MKPRLIALLGFGALFLAFTLRFYLQGLVILLASVLCLAIAMGFFWQGHKSRSFWIAGNRGHGAHDPKLESVRVTIEGREFPVQSLPSRLDFTIAPRNMLMLVAISMVATGSVVSIFVSSDSPFGAVPLESERYVLLYGLSYLMAFLSAPTFAWISECALLRGSLITMATVQGQMKGTRGTLWIRYHFVDPQGGYHGGSVLNFGGPKNDQLKVVFFNPRNADANKVSSGFLFHQISWAGDGKHVKNDRRV
jgi:hypothetical protein